MGTTSACAIFCSMTGDRGSNSPRWPMRLRCMFHLDVAYVAMTIHICCECFFQMFQLFHLDVVCFHLDVAYVGMAICVCSKCFTYFKHMLQAFYLNVVYVAVAIHICCQHMFQFVLPYFSMLQQMMLPTRFDSRARTRCLPLSCGLAPTVGRARNKRSLPNARALHGQSACAHIECHSRPAPNQYITRRPAPPGMTPSM
jgi:hypothetical protein